jgi:two-component system LytT family response regulator
MPPIRTIVVDDEPLARTRITRLLARFEDIQVIGEAKNGHEALEMIRNYRPDLVFLDIQMPDLNGFEVLSRSHPEELPFIIFVTAYDQYALKAFDVHAVDYLLKPYDDERFSQALDQARRQIRMKKDFFIHQKMIRLLETYRQDHSDTLHYIEVKERGTPHHVTVEDIQFIEAHGNYLKLHLADRFHLIRQTLQSMEEAINQPFFLRIHRSILVNTHYIDQLRYKGNNQFQFTMKNGEVLLSSRGYRDAIDKYLEDERIRRNQ